MKERPVLFSAPMVRAIALGVAETHRNRAARQIEPESQADWEAKHG